MSSSTLVGNSESAIAAAIAQHGPVAVSVHVNSKFMHYKQVAQFVNENLNRKADY